MGIDVEVITGSEARRGAVRKGADEGERARDHNTSRAVHVFPDYFRCVRHFGPITDGQKPALNRPSRDMEWAACTAVGVKIALSWDWSTTAGDTDPLRQLPHHMNMM
jgi:hypothetical protein